MSSEFGNLMILLLVCAPVLGIIAFVVNYFWWILFGLIALIVIYIFIWLSTSSVEDGTNGIDNSIGEIPNDYGVHASSHAAPQEGNSVKVTYSTDFNTGSKDRNASSNYAPMKGSERKTKYGTDLKPVVSATKESYRISNTLLSEILREIANTVEDARKLPKNTQLEVASECWKTLRGIAHLARNDEEHVALFMAFADVAKLSNRPDKVIEIYRKARAYSGPEPDTATWCWIAKSFDAQGEHVLAHKAYQQILPSSPRRS